MTDKQKEALELVLDKLIENAIDTKDAMILIESIVEPQTQIQYVPYYQPYTVEPIKPWWLDNQPYCQDPTKMFRINPNDGATTEYSTTTEKTAL